MGRLPEKAGLMLGALFPFIYSVPAFGTFIYLLRADLPDARGLIGSAVIFTCDLFLATIWPLYWAILKWLF